MEKRKYTPIRKKIRYQFPISEVIQQGKTYLHSTGRQAFSDAYEQNKNKYTLSGVSKQVLKNAKSFLKEIKSIIDASEAEVVGKFNASKKELKDFLQDFLTPAKKTVSVDKIDQKFIENSLAEAIQHINTARTSIKSNNPSAAKIKKIAHAVNEVNKKIFNKKEYEKCGSYYREAKQFIEKFAAENDSKGETLNQGKITKFFQSFGWLKEIYTKELLTSTDTELKIKNQAINTLTSALTGSDKGIKDIEINIDAGVGSVSIPVSIKSTQVDVTRNFDTLSFFKKSKKQYEEWARFWQYAYWNSLALKKYASGLDVKSPQEVVQEFDLAQKQISDMLFEAAFYIGLPTALLANSIDAANFNARKEFERLQATPESLQKIKSVFQSEKSPAALMLVVGNKIYWMSEVIKMAEAQNVGKDVSDSTKVHALGGKNLSGTKLELLKEEKEKVVKEKIINSDDGLGYFTLINDLQPLIKDIVKKWNFLLLDKKENKGQYYFKVKYNIKF